MSNGRSKSRDRLLRMAVTAFIKENPGMKYADVARHCGCSASYASRIGLDLGNQPRPAGRPKAEEGAS